MILRRRRPLRALQYAAGAAVFFAVWWGGSYLLGPRVLPTPAQVFSFLANPEVLGRFVGDVSVTVGRGLLGFGLSLLVATPVGAVMGRHGAGERTGFFPLLLLQSAPPLFWITPLVLWLGTRGMVAPVVAFLVSVPLLTLHTQMAIKHIPAYAYDVFVVYAPSSWSVARELYLPHLIPVLRSNAHLGALIAIKAAMLAEWFAAQDGFGRTIRVAYQFFAMTEFVGWAFLFLVVVGFGSLLLHVVLVRLLPMYRPTKAPGGVSGAGADVADSRAPSALLAREPEKPGAPLFEVVDLSFGYGVEPLFSGVSFAVEADRPLVISGPSGCGKTTLLKCIAGILSPRHGTIRGEGQRTLVFQDDALLAHRDALGNVLLPVLPRPAVGDIRRATDCLELWGLADESAKFPYELSGGMRKRVAMSRAWFMNPDVLLLDEPFTNLDEPARRALWERFFVLALARSVATIVVTHYPDELRDFDVSFLPWESIGTGCGSAEWVLHQSASKHDQPHSQGS
ncbi:MAG: ATP-binding cassette domain-containing protein [Spirochaetota bacterium]